MILTCSNCSPHRSTPATRFQDRKHGKGKRVFNKLKTKNGDQHYYRCSCCKKERLV